MGWTCPECGFMNAGEASVCTCGFDRSEFLSPEPVEAELAEALEIDDYPFDISLSGGNTPASVRSAPASAKKAVAGKQPDTKHSSFRPSDRVTLREVGAWRFSFSPSDGRISIGTAALEPFQLELAVDDLEAILEAVYKLAGKGKTFRNLELPEKDVLELVEFIGEMIDDKRSKIRPSFSQEDIGIITSLVNRKLSE